MLSCHRPGELAGVEASWLAKEVLCRSRYTDCYRSVHGAVCDVELADGVANAECSAGLVRGLR